MIKNKSGFIFTLVWIFVIFLYIPIVFQERQTLKNLENELTASIDMTKTLEIEKKELLEQLDSSNELYYVEKFARDYLFMKKKNETIYRVVFEEDKE